MRGQTGRDETRDQQARINYCQADLGRALEVAEKAAKHARRTLNHARQPDLAEFFGATSGVRRAEEALDLAHLDLRTASGEDA